MRKWFKAFMDAWSGVPVTKEVESKIDDMEWSDYPQALKDYYNQFCGVTKIRMALPGEEEVVISTTIPCKTVVDGKLVDDPNWKRIPYPKLVDLAKLELYPPGRINEERFYERLKKNTRLAGPRGVPALGAILDDDSFGRSDSVGGKKSDDLPPPVNPVVDNPAVFFSGM